METSPHNNRIESDTLPFRCATGQGAAHVERSAADKKPRQNAATQCTKQTHFSHKPHFSLMQRVFAVEYILSLVRTIFAHPGYCTVRPKTHEPVYTPNGRDRCRRLVDSWVSSLSCITVITDHRIFTPNTVVMKLWSLLQMGWWKGVFRAGPCSMSLSSMRRTSTPSWKTGS